jgi:phospholipid/cholesterol/gamma-HCH transport system ATP-binding protein
MATEAPAYEPVVELENISTRFGSHMVHQNINLTLRRGEILSLVGGSGSGKSTLLREILLLQRPSTGSIRLFGQEITMASGKRYIHLRCRMGVLFQYSALFGSLTVSENIGLPLREYTTLSDHLINGLVLLKIKLVGLSPDVWHYYPSQLSGGMQKRAALARALALDPELLFLDEPTSGLDPIGANAFDELISNLKQALGLTVLMVTHDLNSLWRISDRIAVLGDSHLIAVGTKDEVITTDHPLIRDFFGGARGIAARNIPWKQG